MKYRALGKSGIKISELSLGTEHLRRPPSRVKKVVSAALDAGVNYIDMVFNLTEHLSTYSAAIEGRRDGVMLAHHLGSSESDGRYRKTRSVGECERVFERFLKMMKTDYADVAHIHFIRFAEEYDLVTAPGGVLDLATRLKEEGRVRLVGISTHEASLVRRAAESGRFDVIMYQVNLAGNAVPGRGEALAACARNGVGVLAMKPFAGGKLLMRGTSPRIHKWQTGGPAVKAKIPGAVTPAQCLNYTLSQVGVSSAVTGVTKLEELEGCLGFFSVSAAEKDYSSPLKDFQAYAPGECTYCDHCLPCPAGIEIGQVIRLLETAEGRPTQALKMAYRGLGPGAGECTRCGECLGRCPFGVDIIAKMDEAAALFEK